MTKVSIAMATFNAQPWILEQLRSLAGQRRPPDEIIIVDDCSSDNTISTIKHFASINNITIKLYQNEKNIGHKRNFFKAISLCTGEVIFLCDQDDIWFEQKIEILLKQIDPSSGVHLVLCDAEYTDGVGRYEHITVIDRCIEATGDVNSHIAGACSALTKGFVNLIEPRDFSRIPQHDVYINRFATVLGCKKVIREVLQIWRIHGSNSSSSAMNTARRRSSLMLFFDYIAVDPRPDYEEKIACYEEIKSLIEERKGSIKGLGLGDSVDNIIDRCNRTISAHRNRLKFLSASYGSRYTILAGMILRGDYRLLYGWRSAVKDGFICLLGPAFSRIRVARSMNSEDRL